MFVVFALSVRSSGEVNSNYIVSSLFRFLQHAPLRTHTLIHRHTHALRCTEKLVNFTSLNIARIAHMHNAICTSLLNLKCHHTFTGIALLLTRIPSRQDLIQLCIIIFQFVVVAAARHNSFIHSIFLSCYSVLFITFAVGP